jgi:alpha-D-xyloside xylohydrolase
MNLNFKLNKIIVQMLLACGLLAMTTTMALSETATASSTSVGSAALTIDGIVGPSSYWQSGSSYPATLTIDLGSSQTVHDVEIELPTTWTQRNQTFSISGSTDNTTYAALAASATYSFDPSFNGNVVIVSFTPATARYVRLTFTANTGGPGAQVSEIVINANLAYGKPITASNTSVGTAALANDGVVGQSSYWQAGGATSTLTVDLGSSQSVDEVAILLPSTWGNRTQTFSILGSTNNTTFTTLVGSTSYLFMTQYSNVVTISFAPATIRYVQLSFTANTAASGGQVSEFQVYGALPNFALNHAISASSSLGTGYAATLANDGVVSQSSYWEGAGGSYPNSLTVDLGDSVGVNSIDIKLPPAWGSRTQTFSVQGSQDNSTFYTILSSATYTFDPSSSNIVTLYFPTVNTRYVQLVFTANSGAGAGQVSEIEVYGSDYFVDSSPLRVLGWQQSNGALNITTSGGILKLQPFLDQALHVQFGSATSLAAAKSYAVLRAPDTIASTVTQTSTNIVMTTALYSVQVSLATSQITIFDASGKQLIQEAAQGGRTPAVGNILNAADNFQLTSTEALYGTGEFRDSAMNLRGVSRDLYQVNTQAAVPVILSTNGWSMFWDNPSETHFSDSSSGMSLSSNAGTLDDFYVVVGTNFDTLVHGYRRLTGTAPMMPEWALGYHQSRNRYASQTDLLSTAAEMRSDQIPMDTIFIDYMYWGNAGFGSNVFDSSAWPNVPTMIQTLHNENTKLIVSVWPSFSPGNSNYTTMLNDGYLISGADTFGGPAYDVFNPAAAAQYWQQIATSLVPLGIDGWFLDGPEPDGPGLSGVNTFAGPGETVLNVYPLLHVSNFYNGLLASNPNLRPYIITRCAWAAQQRNGMTIWSGDTSGTWAELQDQIPAGLNYTACGLPYWTTDIGGYSGGNVDDPAYQELYTRWWEWGTFCPIFRSHGIRGDGTNELWEYGPTVQANCTQFGNLRYRLMPYVYSLTGAITQNDYTPMRLLAFDFASDTNVLNIKDEFMYGPAFLINPVTVAGATSRSVYLPSGTSWTDFWTGTTYTGGQTITAAAPINLIPIYARAGSIVPMGPAEQYTNQTPATPVEVRIYPGANGSFTLYEDDGTTMAYQSGAFTQIPFTWNDSTQTLTIGARQGSYTGMLNSRVFNIVVVKNNGNGAGINPGNPNATVTYTGSQLTVTPNNAVPIGKTISLQAQANNLWVCADNNGTSPLIANRGNPGAWESFTVVDESATYGPGYVALLSATNGFGSNEYVTAVNSTTALIANSTTVGPTQVFYWQSYGNGSISLQSYANSLWVCADNAGSSPLIANRGTPAQWETYNLKIW